MERRWNLLKKGRSMGMWTEFRKMIDSSHLLHSIVDHLAL